MVKNISRHSSVSRLATALLEENVVNEKQLEHARERQRNVKRPIQELLVEMSFAKEEDVIRVASKTFNVPTYDLDAEKVDPSLTKVVPKLTAGRHHVFPVSKKGDTLTLAMSNPLDVVALDDIRIITNMRVKPVLSKKSDIAKCIETHYHINGKVHDILKHALNEAKTTKIEMARKLEIGEGVLDLKNEKYKSSIAVKLSNFMIGDAIKTRASDIHIEPQESFVVVRYRIDGNLKNIMKIPSGLHAALATRIKILSRLNIAENKKPQDGRVRILIDDRKIDLRISTMPTFYGEKIAIRLLDPKEAKVELDKLGFHENELKIFVDAITRPQGMILVTGPTGSGKTSTLYAALNFIKSEIKNIVTIEDPIEYLMEGISQMQVHPIKDVTFANGLRNILRQDPNVILVGEIRDKQAAEIAFRASLTGHLVFSTLHTNNAVSSITRLLDIGLESYFISSSLVLIVAQRLVRITCPHCKKRYRPNKRLLDMFRVYIDKYGIKEFYRGTGCRRCNFTGYFGRTAIFEILRVNEKMKNLIANGASEDVIFREARKSGMKPLAEPAIEKVARGITTLEEVAAVAYVAEEEKVTKKPTAAQMPPIPPVPDCEEDALEVLVS